MRNVRIALFCGAAFAGVLVVAGAALAQGASSNGPQSAGTKEAGTQEAPPSAASAPATAPAASTPDAARIEAARKLLDVTGTSKQFEVAMPRLLADLQRQLERRAPKHKKDVDEVMRALAGKYGSRTSGLVEKVAELYAGKLSAEDIEAVTRFFSEGAGQRYIAAVPDLVQGSQSLGETWGRAMGEEIRKEAETELRKRGIRM